MPTVVAMTDADSCAPEATSSSEQADAQRYADEASWALNLAVRFARNVEITNQLRAALCSRTAIDQGIGIIMGQNRCDADTAFAVLRAASQNRNIKLRDIAAEIITAVSSKSPTVRHPFQDDPPAHA